MKLLATGDLTGRFQMFGALPPGEVTGQWWKDGTPSALVMNVVCVQTDGQSTIECAMSWPFVIEQVSKSALTVIEAEGERLTWVRMP